jgi:hypothetical protein
VIGEPVEEREGALAIKRAIVLVVIFTEYKR